MTHEINIPFPGFYNSWLSDILESEESSRAENEASENETEFPDELKIDESEYGEIQFRAMDYDAAQGYIARKYLETFDEWAGEALGETRAAWRNRYDYETKTTTKERYRADSLGLKFTDMTSPREYNFTTDRLFASLSMAQIKRMFKMSKADCHDSLRETIKKRFTSYDGFISHYSNRISDWLVKPLAEWDHNEYGTLLIACLAIQGADDESFMWKMLEISELGYSALDHGMDWAKYDSLILEKRAEKLAEWIETDPESVAQYRAGHGETFEKIVAADSDLFASLEDLPTGDECGAFYRCPLTPDLFAGDS